MRRAFWSSALAGCLVVGCGDGSLRAFEPQVVAGAGSGGQVVSLPLLIDDFEDGDIRAKEPLGWWYPVNDETGTQGFGIEPGNRGTASVYALRTHGNGFESWGSAVGVDLVGDAKPLALASSSKLCFDARVEAGSSTAIEVHLLRGTLHYNREVSLSEAWVRYCLPVADFSAATRETLVPDELIALQFFFAPASPFAFWLDDVELVP